MKKLFTLTFIIVEALIGMLSMPARAAESPTYSVPLQQAENPMPVPDYRGGRRSLSRPVMCIITPDGFQSSIDSADIIAYELWDETEICLISTSDEAEFIDMLYNLQGEVTLRIITEDCAYIGFLSI